MLNKEGAPVKIRAYKTDSFDNEGTPLWILSAHIDEMQENMQLVNQVIISGFWSVKCDQHGKPTDVFFSHEFRKMLGYHNILDFPDSLETWQAGVHPGDIEMVDKAFYDAFRPDQIALHPWARRVPRQESARLRALPSQKRSISLRWLSRF